MTPIPNGWHPRCGGQWRGPFTTDGGPVLVCNTCGDEENPAEPAENPPARR